MIGITVEEMSRARELAMERLPDVAAPQYATTIASDLVLYKATANASGGEITVKVVTSSGTVIGDNVTLKVLP